jgi:hypothetical protein
VAVVDAEFLVAELRCLTYAAGWSLFGSEFAVERSDGLGSPVALEALSCACGGQIRLSALAAVDEFFDAFVHTPVI